MGHPAYHYHMTHVLLYIHVFVPASASVWSWVDAQGGEKGSCSALGGDQQTAPSHPPKSSPPALTLRTVSLGVDNGSGSSKHSTAGPRDRSSHLLGETGWRMVGEGAASAQAGTSWGAPPYSQARLGNPSPRARTP